MREERLLDVADDREEGWEEARLPPVLDEEGERLVEPPELLFLFRVEAMGTVLLSCYAGPGV